MDVKPLILGFFSDYFTESLKAVSIVYLRKGPALQWGEHFDAGFIADVMTALMKGKNIANLYRNYPQQEDDLHPYMPLKVGGTTYKFWVTRKIVEENRAIYSLRIASTIMVRPPEDDKSVICSCRAKLNGRDWA